MGCSADEVSIKSLSRCTKKVITLEIVKYYLQNCITFTVVKSYVLQTTNNFLRLRVSLRETNYIVTVLNIIFIVTDAAER